MGTECPERQTQRIYGNADFTKLKRTKKSGHQKNPKICQTVRHKCAFGLDTWSGFQYCP